MKKIIFITALGLLLSCSAFAYNYYGKKCSADKNCTACKNCSGCKNCAKEGGTCGVCKK